MTLAEHARDELERLGEFKESPAYAQSLVAAVAVLMSYAHSGGSMWVATDQLGRLLRGEALTPITDDVAEWVDRSHMSSKPWWQNRRDSRAMSHDAGRTWWFVEARNPGERYRDGEATGTMVCCPGCSGAGVIRRPDGGDDDEGSVNGEAPPVRGALTPDVTASERRAGWSAEPSAEDLMDRAWGLICNVSEGNWKLQTTEWQEAAAGMRDAWHAYLNRVLVKR